jgi:hypothetical protein
MIDNEPDSRPTNRFSRRRALAATSAAALAAATVGRFGDAQDAPPSLQPASPAASPVAELDDALLFDVIGELARAGVSVYLEADSPGPLVPPLDPGPVALLMSQLRPMVREAMLGGGVLGADLDALVMDQALPSLAESDTFSTEIVFPEIDGRMVIPPSLLTASYIANAESAGAALVRRFRPDISLEQPATQLIPSLGMLLFAAEVAREHGEAAAVSPGGVRALLPVGMQGGICTQAQSFIDNTINQLFSMLMIDLGTSQPGQILSSILNGVILGFRIPLKAALDALTKPVLDLVRDIAGVVAVAATVVSTIRPWSLQLTAAPTATRLAVGAEPGLPGDVNVTVDLGGFDEWPADVADCAAAAGVPLPPLKPANARCAWLVTGTRPGLVATDVQPPALDGNAKAKLTYHTLSESEEVAKGDPAFAQVLVTATVARPEVDDLKRTLANLLFAQLPAIVDQFVRPYLGPVVDQLLGKVASLTDSKGTVAITVLYHQPPKNTPTPDPEPEPDGETGFSLDFVMVPIQGAPPVSITFSVASCDGEAWSGTVAMSFVFDPEAFEIDVVGEASVAWDFAGESQATATSGPFEGTIVVQPTAASSLVYVLDLTIARSIELGEDDDEGVDALTFEVVIHSTFFGSTETEQLIGFTNLGVPVPVVAGGADCAQE